MSSYRQALKAARIEYIRKLIDNNQNNPRFLFSTMARLTNKQMSPDLNIPSQFNSNDFMNFFTDKIDNIRNTITNVDSTASCTSASFIAPKEKLHCFATIGQDELNKLITASKPTTFLLDPVPTKLLKELLPVAEEPLLNIIVMNLVATHFNCTSPMDYIAHHALHTHIPVHHYTNHTAVTIHSSTLIASPHLHLIHSLT